MPRGSPKKPYGLRLDPALMEEVRTLTSNMTQAVEEALRAWLWKRKNTKQQKEKYHADR